MWIKKVGQILFCTKASEEAMGFGIANGYPNMILFADEAGEKSSKESTRKMLANLYDHVLANENPDILQLWYGLIFNHIFCKLYPTYATTASPMPKAFSLMCKC